MLTKSIYLNNYWISYKKKILFIFKYIQDMLCVHKFKSILQCITSYIVAKFTVWILYKYVCILKIFMHKVLMLRVCKVLCCNHQTILEDPRLVSSYSYSFSEFIRFTISSYCDT